MSAKIYWIDGPWSGRLAIVPRPRGGDWLEDDLRSMRSAGIDVLVSALEKEEAEELDLVAEPSLAKSPGIEFMPIPIRDRGVPLSTASFVSFLQQVDTHLRAGKNVAIHCRQGVGRSSLIAAALLGLGGVEPEAAWSRIQTSRGCAVPDTKEQREWLAHAIRELMVHADSA